jgi:hypothetical protein
MKEAIMGEFRQKKRLIIFFRIIYLNRMNI